MNRIDCLYKCSFETTTWCLTYGAVCENKCIAAYSVACGAKNYITPGGVT